jgi:D-sedoheptulose 7-phosphate isomerase
MQDLASAVKRAKRVYLIGNGGSYANAVHIANDLLSVGVKAYTMDPATLTAFANDHGYENAFAKWAAIVAEKGDLIVGLSGSGKSPNILRALDFARGAGIETMLVTNYLQDFDMQVSEEKQLRIGHNAMRALRDGI